MSKTPVAAPRTVGRVFDTDWSVANVAKLLRSNAGRGVWRHEATTGDSTGSVNQYYLRTVSARHLPSGVSLIFMRLEQENCWYASLCFAGADGVLPWNPEAAELWLWALFGEDRPRVREAADATRNVRQFTLASEPPP
jgi:hypothetical protein